MTNPLDLAGPQFLQFYLVAGVLVLLALLMVRRLLQSSGPDAAEWRPGRFPREADAYALALLRDGRPAAVRTLLTRLSAEGVIDVSDSAITVREDANLGGLSDLERATWDAVRAGVSPGRVVDELVNSLSGEFGQLEQRLRGEGLLFAPNEIQPFLLLMGVGLLLVPGFGVIKLFVALSRGRTNVGFLLILIVLYAVVIGILLWPPRATGAGRRYLGWLNESHQGLLDLLRAGKRTGAGEVALAAAVYGLAPLALVEGVAQVEHLIQRNRRQDSSASTGSSCSSSSCSGGCGGGGGCGGCGS